MANETSLYKPLPDPDVSTGSVELTHTMTLEPQ